MPAVGGEGADTSTAGLVEAGEGDSEFQLRERSSASDNASMKNYVTPKQVMVHMGDGLGTKNVGKAAVDSLAQISSHCLDYVSNTSQECSNIKVADLSSHAEGVTSTLKVVDCKEQEAVIDNGVKTSCLNDPNFGKNETTLVMDNRVMKEHFICKSQA
eukprot:c26238_g1_i1 orf=1149-1622(+)